MSRPYTRSQAPKPNNAGKVTERLPPEILSLVCQALEGPPPEGRALVLHKHHKIRSILQIKNTCKSWYAGLVTARFLFREIAFDARNASTVVSAQACLRLLGEGSRVPLHVFIAGFNGDMDRSNKLRRKIVLLLRSLSNFAPYIAHCQVWNPSNIMCSYLAGSALTLEYLSIGVTAKDSVFSGPLPSLRTMEVTTSNRKLWQAYSFPVLSDLRLSYAGPTEASLRALADLLQGIPQLQNLHLDNFSHWDSRRRFLPKSGLDSNTLRSLTFTNCDFPQMLQYLRAPKLRTLLIHGTRHNNDATPLPFFQDSELLEHVETAPVLGTCGLCSITAVARQELTKRSLVVEISGNGRQFQVRLEWLRWRQGDWERWVRNSCRNLLERSRLSSSVSLTVDFDRPSIETLHPIFSTLPCAKTLAVVGGSLCETLQHLAVFDRLSYRLHFPALKLLDLTTRTTITVKEGNEIKTFLQFRANVDASVEVAVSSPAWREARGFPWTSFMIANGGLLTTTLTLRP